MKTRFSHVATCRRRKPSDVPARASHPSTCCTVRAACSFWCCAVSSSDGRTCKCDDLEAVPAVMPRGGSTFEQSAFYQIELSSQATECRGGDRYGRFGCRCASMRRLGHRGFRDRGTREFHVVADRVEASITGRRSAQRRVLPRGYRDPHTSRPALSRRDLLGGRARIDGLSIGDGRGRR